MFSKLKRILPTGVMKRLYFALFHSHLNYLIGAWGSANKGFIKAIQTLQKRCLKHVFKLPQRYPTIDLFANYCHDILNINSLYKANICNFIYKAVNDHSHNTIQFNKPSHAFDTRNRDRLVVSLAKTKKGTCAISSSGCAIFNDVPGHIKKLTPNRFKAELKKWLLDRQYPKN